MAEPRNEPEVSAWLKGFVERKEWAKVCAYLCGAIERTERLGKKMARVEAQFVIAALEQEV